MKTRRLIRDKMSRQALAIAAIAFACAHLHAQDPAPFDIDSLIQASRAATVEGEPIALADGATLTPRVPRPADPLHTWTPPQDWPAPRPDSPGSIVRMAWTSKPYAIQPLEDGRILIGMMDSIAVVENATSLEPTMRSISDAGARVIQPNEDGSRLLVTTFTEPRVRILDSGTLAEVAQIKVGPGDVTAWWGETSDTIITAREGVDFRSDSENRIFLAVSERNLTTGVETSLDWPATYFAAIGTIAPQGLVWALRTRPFQIDPMPAPLIALEGGKVRGLLTVTSTHSDIHPAGGRDGWLYWIRTLSRGGRSGRLMMRDVAEAESPEIQLNSEPTQLLGVSPTGGVVAWMTGDLSTPGSLTLRVASSAELRDAETGDMGTADRIVEEAWRLVLTRLRLAFDKTSAATGATVRGPMVTLQFPVTSTELDAMGEAFELALAEAFPGEAENLFARADALLDTSEGLLPQEPSVICGIAGMFVREARRREMGTVLLANSTAALSETLSTWIETDGMTHRKVSPFAVARERLEGTLRLSDAMGSLLEPHAPPIFFVENFGNEVNANITNFLLGIAGLKDDAAPLQDLGRALDRMPSCDLCALRLAREGADSGAPELALSGARALVERHPASAEAFALLADALFANGMTDEARPAMEWAVTLSPADAELRYRLGSMLLTLGESDASREAFESIRNLPEYGFYQTRIAARLELLESTQKEPTP